MQAFPKTLIFIKTVFNLYASAYVRACSNLLSCPIAGHAEMLILVETVFNFYALAYDFKTELRRCSLGRGHEWDENVMPGGRSYSIHQKCEPCAHSPRTHRALTAHSKNGVMWSRGPWSSISSMRPWEHLVHVFRVSFYTL